jgi:hypothetical protein
MSETTHNLIQAMVDGDALKTEQAFGAAMAEKLSTKLDAMRTDIAQNMFNAQQPVVEESLDEAAAKPSIGKLAADHYEHEAAGNKTKSQATLSKIEQHHGKEAADAVAQHTNHANSVDNTSGGAKVPKHFHSDFVNKHLGGKGSSEHEAYKKQSAKHYNDDAGHATDSNWNAHA